MEKIVDSINKNKDKILRFLKTLIHFKTINPSKDHVSEINKAIDYVSEIMGDLGAINKVYKTKNDIPILTCLFPGKLPSDSKKKLIWNGHLDVVPIGDHQNWDGDPFSGMIKNDKIYGRGATDMKGSIASVMFAISNILNYETLDNDLLFIFTSDEETGSKSLYQIDNSLLKEGSACIVGEPTNSSLWKKGYSVGESGIIWVKIIFKGKTAHASVDFMGDNAIEKSNKLLSILPEIRKVKQPLFPRYESLIIDILKECSNEFRDFYQAKLENIRISPTMAKAGVKLNVIPDHAEIDFDIRTLPGANHNKIMNIIKKYMRNAEINDFEIKVMYIQPPSISNISNTDLENMKNAIKMVSNDYSYIIHPACTEARFFRKFMPTICLGAGDMRNAHAINEYITFKELIETTKIYASIFYNY